MKRHSLCSVCVIYACVIWCLLGKGIVSGISVVFKKFLIEFLINSGLRLANLIGNPKVWIL